MIERAVWIGLARAGLALVGLTVAVFLGWNALTGSELSLLFSGWCVPAVPSFISLNKADAAVRGVASSTRRVHRVGLFSVSVGFVRQLRPLSPYRASGRVCRRSACYARWA
jgi:hypothetical protein